MKSRRAKAVDISQKVKREVWARDGQQCILCGNREAMPNAHVVPRSKGGRGIARNVVTLCFHCHRALDQGVQRKVLREQIVAYLKSFYPDWTEGSVTYNKQESV